jgi:hypothetical protein
VSERGVEYRDGTVLRYAVTAQRDGSHCQARGDSGGPVYRVNSAGKVVALGIFSGSGVHSGKCRVHFTDIRDAIDGLSGTVATD